jgi:hypothetical protein
MDDCDKTPFICCGCSKFGVEISNVSKALSFGGIHPDYMKSNYGILLDKVCNLESERSNANRVEEVLQRTNCILEINELGNGKEIPATILKEIADNFPELSIVSVCLTPAGGLSGLATLNSLITTQAMMEYSDSVMFREVDEALSFLSSDVLPDGIIMKQNAQINLQMKDIYQYIASDVFVAMTSHGNSSWPFNVCTTRSKLFDVRSSIWRSIKRSPKSKSAFNPLRAVSSSLHSLHLWHDDFSQWSIRNVHCASITDLKIDKDMNCLVTVPSSNSVPNVLTSIEGATPNLSWHLSPDPLSYADINTSKSSRSSRTDVDNHSITNANNFALSFESPYAQRSLKDICKKADKLLAIGAYARRYVHLHCNFLTLLRVTSSFKLLTVLSV